VTNQRIFSPEYCNKHKTTIDFADHSVDTKEGIRWSSTVTLNSHTDPFPPLRQYQFPRKRLARQYACKCAIDWLVAQSRVPAILPIKSPVASSLRRDDMYMSTNTLEGMERTHPPHGKGSIITTANSHDRTNLASPGINPDHLATIAVRNSRAIKDEYVAEEDLPDMSQRGRGDLGNENLNPTVSPFSQLQSLHGNYDSLIDRSSKPGRYIPAATNSLFAAKNGSSTTACTYKTFENNEFQKLLNKTPRKRPRNPEVDIERLLPIDDVLENVAEAVRSTKKRVESESRYIEGLETARKFSKFSSISYE
jgi:hypothetical protein